MNAVDIKHLRHRRNAATRSAAIKLGIFTVISLLVTGLLGAIMGNVGFGPGHEYRAIFTNATMLQKGDDVRIAGVSVGEVRRVEHHQRSMAMVTFRVKVDVEMTEATRAEVRFLNLVGDRYLALEEGAGAAEASGLAPGDTIPVSQTKPALDLTTLFDGFKPLFQALTPDQVNELSLNLVQVLQGEGGTVASLMEHTASLTNALADRDELIGKVITNLTETLETVDRRSGQLSELVIGMRDWMADLAEDREVIGSSLENISDLAAVLEGFVSDSRPLLKEDIEALHDLAELMTEPENLENLSGLLERLPPMMYAQTRTGTYGSWYQYYICGVSARIRLPVIADLPVISEIQRYIDEFWMMSTAPRCER
jgi:phospholipid/cholesterol/gamma-HCH transport system substrate-binding protein